MTTAIDGRVLLATSQAPPEAEFRRWFADEVRNVSLPVLLGDSGRALVVSAFRLTPREAELLWQLFENSSNVAVAQALRVTEHTARTHRERVFAKLGVATCAAALAKVAAAAVFIARLPACNK